MIFKGFYPRRRIESFYIHKQSTGTKVQTHHSASNSGKKLKKKENTEVSTVKDIDKLLNDSVELIRYARGLVARQFYLDISVYILRAEENG